MDSTNKLCVDPAWCHDLGSGIPWGATNGERGRNGQMPQGFLKLLTLELGEVDYLTLSEQIDR